MLRTYTTSYEGLVGRGQAKKGDWVLVLAGAGGVGLAACQIAKAIGCKVIAAASSDEKRRVCKDKAGVNEVVDYTKDGWQVGFLSLNKLKQSLVAPLARHLVSKFKLLFQGISMIVS